MALWRKEKPIPILIGYGKYKGSVALLPARYLELVVDRQHYRYSRNADPAIYLSLKLNFERYVVDCLGRKITFNQCGGHVQYSDFTQSRPKLSVRTTPDYVAGVVDRLGNEITVKTAVAVCHLNVLRTGVVTRITTKLWVRVPGRKSDIGFGLTEDGKAPRSVLKLHKGIMDQLVLEKLSS